MKKNIQTFMIALIAIVLITGCSEYAPNEITSENDNSSLNKLIDWTVSVQYPYTDTGTLSSSLTLYYTNSAEWYQLVDLGYYGYYNGPVKSYKSSTSYNFPNGISEFDSNPNFSMDFDCTAHYLGPYGPYVGDMGPNNYDYTDKTSGYTIIKLLWVEYSISLNTVNMWYPKDPAEISVTYTAEGDIHKTSSGSYSSRNFSIDLGVSGLTVNDLTITDNNINLMAGSLVITGTILTGEMMYY